MASGLNVGEDVYVPVHRLEKNASVPYSIAKGKIQRIVERTVVVKLPSLGERRVATSAVHRNVGILVLKIGDFRSEDSLLDPLTKSLVNYCRLLVPDDQVRYLEIRTWDEFEAVIADHHTAYTHVVIVGHGNDVRLCFVPKVHKTARDIVTFMDKQGVQNKVFLSLCCHTGKAAFAKTFSRSASCSALMAPLGPLHGASASQFAQTYFAYHFLEGRTQKVAFNKARRVTPGASRFRYWKNGQFEGGT